MKSSEWFAIENAHTLDSPSLLVYANRVERNIKRMIDEANGTERLIPHIKTNKMPAVVAMMLQAGISRFKCATIAEAEMLAMTGAKYVLIAHQLVPPKTARLLALKQRYPDVFFASLVDNLLTARQHSDFFAKSGLKTDVFLDVDNGMNRSGAAFGGGDTLLGLYRHIAELPALRLHGLHVYDGHIRDNDFNSRQSKIESGFDGIDALVREIEHFSTEPPIVIAGGTPAFSTHKSHTERFCSPGIRSVGVHTNHLQAASGLDYSGYGA
jgi:D-serine deaminase-like pyridoxal phosphate-dependent protein